MRRRRKTEVFGLSFLDCICCGFGATVLIYMILNAGHKERAQDVLGPMRAETNRLEEQVLEGQANLVELRNTLERVREDAVTTRGLSTRLIDVVKQSQEELATFERETIAQREHVNKLQADLRSLEEGNKRLTGGAPSREVPGDKVRSFVGNGDRQYLTGLKVGGKRILFLVDASASMLADTIVNVVRRRLLPERRPHARGQVAPRRARDRLAHDADPARLELPDLRVRHGGARRSCPAPRDGGWRRATASRWTRRSSGCAAPLPRVAPACEKAFAAATALSPRPDNIILLTDGLPTQGVAPAAQAHGLGQGAGRSCSTRATQALPQGVPVNTLLFPMEGDPVAAPRVLEAGHGHERLVHDPVAGLAVKRPRREHRRLQPLLPGLHLLRLRRDHPPADAHPHDRAASHRARRRRDLQGRIARLEREMFEIRGADDDPEPRAARPARAAVREERGGGAPAGRPHATCGASGRPAASCPRCRTSWPAACSPRSRS